MCIYIMEYYSGLKKKDTLTSMIAWINPENPMLSEISQSQKHKYCTMPLICGI